MKKPLLILFVFTFISGFSQEFRTGIALNNAFSKKTELGVKYQSRFYTRSPMSKYADVLQLSGKHKIYKNFGLSAAVRYSRYRTNTDFSDLMPDYPDRLKYYLGTFYQSKRLNGYRHYAKFQYLYSDYFSDKKKNYLALEYNLNYKAGETIRFLFGTEMIMDFGEPQYPDLRGFFGGIITYGRAELEISYMAECKNLVPPINYTSYIQVMIGFEFGR